MMYVYINGKLQTGLCIPMSGDDSASVGGLHEYNELEGII